MPREKLTQNSDTRRQFCASVGTTAALLGPSVGTARAQTVEITGTVTTPEDLSLAGNTVTVASSSNNRQRTRAPLGSDGEFTVEMTPSATYQLSFHNRQYQARYASTPDGLPVIYHFGTRGTDDGDRADRDDRGDDGEFGELILPEAPLTSIRCTDTEGNPIEGLPVRFRDSGGTATAPDVFTTTSDGYVRFRGASQTGVELTGPVTVEAQTKRGSRRNTAQLRSIVVGDRTEFQLRVSDPAQYPGVTVNSDTQSPTEQPSPTQTPSDRTEPSTRTPTENPRSTSTDEQRSATPPQTAVPEPTPQRSRGFFSNSPASEQPTGPFSNAVNLTTVGFVLSVAGIGYQLLQGR